MALRRRTLYLKGAYSRHLIFLRAPTALFELQQPTLVDNIPISLLKFGLHIREFVSRNSYRAFADTHPKATKLALVLPKQRGLIKIFI
jgi:hypothetical protein